MSGLAKRQNWIEFNDLLLQAVKIIAMIAIPVTIYSLISGKELISLVYKSKHFDDNSVKLTLSAFNFHIAGLFFIALNRIVSPAFYAQGNTKLPTLAGILGFVVNILCALILVRPMSGGGIALALSLASFANTVFLFIFMKKSEGINLKLLIKGAAGYSLKMVLFSLIAGVPAWFVHRATLGFFESRGRILGSGGSVVTTAAVFFGCGLIILLVTKDSIIVKLISMVKGKIKR